MARLDQYVATRPTLRILLISQLPLRTGMLNGGLRLINLLQTSALRYFTTAGALPGRGRIRMAKAEKHAPGHRRSRARHSSWLKHYFLFRDACRACPQSLICHYDISLAPAPSHRWTTSTGDACCGQAGGRLDRADRTAGFILNMGDSMGTRRALDGNGLGPGPARPHR